MFFFLVFYQNLLLQVNEEKLSPSVWPVKAQLDTLTQCYANSVFLACPILVAALNPTPHFHVVELIGLAIWAVSWGFENLADAQKHLFLMTNIKAGKKLAGKKLQWNLSFTLSNSVYIVMVP